MRVDDMILVSIDDHVIEPPDMFERHIPERFRDRAPRVVRGADGINLARSGAEDPELTNAVVSAYNDWHIDEWAGEHPGRFIPLAIGQLLDFDALVNEIHRIAAKGCTAISLPETPYGVGLPSFFGDEWDPVLAALCDEDMVACMHIGGAF